MPVMSAKLSDALVKTTSARDVNDAFNKVFTEYLELKLEQLHRVVEKFQLKWGMSFVDFKRKIKENALESETYSFDTENDFWQWEEAETLKEHYSDIRQKWM